MVIFFYQKKSIFILSYSDSIIIRALTFLLTKIYSNNLPINIINYRSFFLKNKILRSFFSNKRNNALKIILNRIRYQAVKYLI